MQTAVVGGGIVGLNAARFLLDRGHRVTLYEQYPLFHDRGSSHGRTRIVRRAYPDPFFTACMTEAYPLWGDLELVSGLQLVHEVGLFYFGNTDSERMKSMEHGLRDCDVPFTIHDPLETRGVFPALRLEAGEAGIFTPEAGWVEAETALRATFDLAKRGGLVVEQQAATLQELERDYDAFAVAPGGWIRDWADVPVKVTLETFGYAQAKIGGPVWIDDTDFAYGFPSDYLGLKLGAHLKGDQIDPHSDNRTPHPERMKAISAKVRQRFGLDVAVTHWKGCIYTSTADEDFLFGRLGTSGFFASACSGHGFKFGPWSGRMLANFIEGSDTPERWQRFCWPRLLPSTG